MFLRRRAKDWHIFGFQKNGEKRKIYWLLCQNVLVWGEKRLFYTEPFYAKVRVSTIWQCTEREILRSPFPASQYLCSTSVLLHSHSFCIALVYTAPYPPQIQCKRRKRRIRWLGRAGGLIAASSIHPPVLSIGARNSTKVAPTVGVL